MAAGTLLEQFEAEMGIIPDELIAGIRPNQITNEEVYRYRRNGFFLLHDALPLELVEAMNTVGDYVLQLDAENPHNLNNASRSFSDIDLWEKSGLMRAFARSPLVQDICSVTVGTNVNHNHYFYVEKRKSPEGEEDRSVFLPHMDSGYISFLHKPYSTIWLALQAMPTVETGTAQLLTYDEAGTRERQEHIEVPGATDKVWPGYQRIGTEVLGHPALFENPGGMAVFSSVSVHWTGPTNLERRRAVVLQNGPVDLDDGYGYALLRDGELAA